MPIYVTSLYQGYQSHSSLELLWWKKEDGEDVLTPSSTEQQKTKHQRRPTEISLAAWETKPGKRHLPTGIRPNLPAETKPGKRHLPTGVRPNLPAADNRTEPKIRMK